MEDFDETMQYRRFTTRYAVLFKPASLERIHVWWGVPYWQIMMTSSKWNVFRATGLCVGNSPVTGEFPTQRPVTRSFEVFFDLPQNKRLGKQSWGWWFETPSCTLWRHCNVSCKWLFLTFRVPHMVFREMLEIYLSERHLKVNICR